MQLYNVYSLYEITPVRGKGAYIYDSDGKEYLDFYGGHAVISIGHTHPEYVRRLKDQLDHIGFYSNSVINPLQEELAKKLAECSKEDNYELFLINSGAEANENALKLASFYNARNGIIALENSFHGRTSAAINITHSGRRHQAAINKGIPVQYCDFRDIASIKEHINTGNFSAIIIEAIQGVGGLDMVANDHLKEIEKACRSTNTILILDEVQCGYGRSGQFFAFQEAGIHPDIITTAKGMGNGFPIGGVLINAQKIPAHPSRLGTTYGGNHLACTAAIAVLEVIEKEKLIDNARAMGELLRKELTQFSQIKRIKGKGLMMGIEMDFPINELRKKLIFEQGLFTGSASNPNLLRLLPPLNISYKEVEQFISKLRIGLQSI